MADEHDATGQRRLDDPEDFVRREITLALRRDIRVGPALVQGTSMPRATSLPDDLQPLTRRNAMELSDTHFHRDVDQLIMVLDRVLGVTPSPSVLAETRPPHVLPAGRLSYLRSWKWWGLMGLIFASMASIVALYVIPPPQPEEPDTAAAAVPPGLIPVDVRLNQSGADACDAQGMVCVSMTRSRIHDENGKFSGYSTPTCAARVVREPSCSRLFKVDYAMEGVVLRRSPGADPGAQDPPPTEYFCLRSEKGKQGIYQFAHCVKP